MSSDRVTCLIPTRNRNSFLQRAVAFLTVQYPDVQLVVADSSHEAEHLKNLEILRQSELKSVKVLHYDYESGFYQKIAAALSEIYTPYFYFMADDDFIFPDGVEACCQTLDFEKDLIAAAGELLVYNMDRPNQFSPYLNYSLSTYPSQDELIDMASWRVSNHIKNYRATFYSVYRSDIAKECFIKLAKNSANIRLAEIFSSAYVMARGKRRIIPTVLGVRTTHEEADHRHTQTMVEMLGEVPDFINEIRGNFDALIELIGKEYGNASTLLGDGIAAYLKRVGFSKDQLEEVFDMLSDVAMVETPKFEIPELKNDITVVPQKGSDRFSELKSSEMSNLGLVIHMCDAAPAGIKADTCAMFVKKVQENAKKSLIV